jgi:hypothetical protein
MATRVIIESRCRELTPSMNPSSRERARTAIRMLVA